MGGLTYDLLLKVMIEKYGVRMTTRQVAEAMKVSMHQVRAIPGEVLSRHNVGGSRGFVYMTSDVARIIYQDSHGDVKCEQREPVALES